MSYSTENLAEINLLIRYKSSASLEGIKIHKTADPSVIAAAQRLHDAGFITQVDGGYLTPLGAEAEELAQRLLL
jgi:uncharacterized protein (TIGR02647 family)